MDDASVLGNAGRKRNDLVGFRERHAAQADESARAGHRAPIEGDNVFSHAHHPFRATM